MKPLRIIVPTLLLFSALAASSASAQAPCAPGFFSATGMEPCAPCATGTYNPYVGAFECAPCSPGFHSPNPGSVVCSACVAGTYSGDGAAECSTCAGGTFSTPGSAFCAPCVAGKYSPPGSGACLNCDPGYFSMIGSETCTPCPPGSFSSMAGSGTCSTCPDGSIAPNSGTLVCTPCAEGQTSNPTHTECVDVAGTPTDLLPTATHLGPATPNPARQIASFELGLAHDADVRLSIHDLSGRVLRTLVSERLSAGVHRRAWDLRTDRGVAAAPGVYFARLSGAGADRVRMVYVLR